MKQKGIHSKVLGESVGRKLSKSRIRASLLVPAVAENVSLLFLSSEGHPVEGDPAKVICCFVVFVIGRASSKCYSLFYYCCRQKGVHGKGIHQTASSKVSSRRGSTNHYSLFCYFVIFVIGRLPAEGVQQKGVQGQDQGLPSKGWPVERWFAKGIHQEGVPWNGIQQKGKLLMVICQQ